MRSFLVFFLLVVPGHLAFGQGAVFLFGGGARPQEAMRQLVKAAGGIGQARFLVLAWASETPEDTSAGVRQELVAAGALEARVSLSPPATDEGRAQLNRELQWATGVFFSGGDQVRLLDGLQRAGDVRQRVLNRWQAGLPLAGTSAGTAALSERVFTGKEDLSVIDPNAVELRAGLGVLRDVIIDQHFLVRQRENRLFSAVLRYAGSLGVGIDEDNVLIVHNSRIGKIIGPTAVMFVERVSISSRIGVTLLRNGQCWDFQKRAETGCHVD